MKRLTAISLIVPMLLIAVAITSCGSDDVGPGSTIPEVGGDATAASGVSDPVATATPDVVVPTQEPTSTPQPTATPQPDYVELYRTDVEAALATYFKAVNGHNEPTYDQIRTAATRELELNTLEERKNTAAMLGWLDYPHIEVTEITHMKCDEVLCKVWFSGISTPPVENPVSGRDLPFEFEADILFFRLINGGWLEDHTHETWTEEFKSTHRE